jgi:hypothetical protein
MVALPDHSNEKQCSILMERIYFFYDVVYKWVLKVQYGTSMVSSWPCLRFILNNHYTKSVILTNESNLNTDVSIGSHENIQASFKYHFSLTEQKQRHWKHVITSDKYEMNPTTRATNCNLMAIKRYTSRQVV